MEKMPLKDQSIQIEYVLYWLYLLNGDAGFSVLPCGLCNGLRWNPLIVSIILAFNQSISCLPWAKSSQDNAFYVFFINEISDSMKLHMWKIWK